MVPVMERENFIQLKFQVYHVNGTDAAQDKEYANLTWCQKWNFDFISYRQSVYQFLSDRRKMRILKQKQRL